jgi:hypothetical protein
LNVAAAELPRNCVAERAVDEPCLARVRGDARAGAAELLAALALPPRRGVARRPEDVAAEFAAARSVSSDGGARRPRRGESTGTLVQLALDGLVLERADGTRARVALEHARALDARRLQSPAP